MKKNSKPAYNKTKAGVISCIYKHQKWNSKNRGRSIPDYSRQEFSEWIYKNGFESVYEAWRKSGFDPWLRPSVDRIDSKLSYFFGNIELVTWRENRDRQTRDILAGYGPSGKMCKRVKCITTGDSYVSIAAACRKVGYSIYKNVAKGTRDKGGLRWVLE